MSVCYHQIKCVSFVENITVNILKRLKYYHNSLSIQQLKFSMKQVYTMIWKENGIT